MPPKAMRGSSDQPRMAPQSLLCSQVGPRRWLFFSDTLLETYGALRFSGMTERELEQQLHTEGFHRTHVWQDAPHAHYPAHTHAALTAHIILEGEMTLTIAGESKTYRTGDRCDVPSGTVHAARMGPQGCRYLIGEK